MPTSTKQKSFFFGRLKNKERGIYNHFWVMLLLSIIYYYYCIIFIVVVLIIVIIIVILLSFAIAVLVLLVGEQGDMF